MNTQLKLTNDVQSETHDEEPSFMVGDLVLRKGDEEGGSFTVRGLMDGGRTVFLGDGFKSPHTSLKPTPIQVREYVRSSSGLLRGIVTGLVDDSIQFETSNGLTYGLPRSECRATAFPFQGQGLTQEATRLRTWKVNHVEGGVELTLNGQTFMVDSATIPSIMFDLGRSGH